MCPLYCARRIYTSPLENLSTAHTRKFSLTSGQNMPCSRCSTVFKRTAEAFCYWRQCSFADIVRSRDTKEDRLDRRRRLLLVKFLLGLCILFASYFGFCTKQPLHSISCLYFVALLTEVKCHDMIGPMYFDHISKWRTTQGSGNQISHKANP